MSSYLCAAIPLEFLRLLGIRSCLLNTHRRTFLSWLHFAVVLGGLAVGLLNFGDKVSCEFHPSYTSFSPVPRTCDHEGCDADIHRSGRFLLPCTPSSVCHLSRSFSPRISPPPPDLQYGSRLTDTAMAVMLYALVIYQMRARSIRLRTGAPYDDRLGPVSTCSNRHVRGDYTDRLLRRFYVSVCSAQSSRTSS